MVYQLNLPDGYDWAFSFRETIISDGFTDEAKINLERIGFLVKEALDRCGKSDAEYELFGNPSRDWMDGYYGLKVHYDFNVCVLYCSSRGLESAVAVFPVNHISAAAEYFVYIVSDGFGRIDWGR